MDQVAEKLASYEWPYAENDIEALHAILRKIADTGEAQDLITYSDVVRGITFRMANVSSGEPIRLGVPEWSELHRAILGDFLGRACLATYERGRFLGSALVVGKVDGQPSEGFRSLVRELGLVGRARESDFTEFWIAEVANAHAWYREHAW